LRQKNVLRCLTVYFMPHEVHGLINAYELLTL
jgi:hypothetical protein